MPTRAFLLRTCPEAKYESEQCLHGRDANGYAFQVFGGRNPHTAVSPAELSALRRAAYGLANFLPSNQRDTLVAMGLIAVITRTGNVVLTEAGKQRLTKESETAPLPENDNPPDPFV